MSFSSQFGGLKGKPKGPPPFFAGPLILGHPQTPQSGQLTMLQAEKKISWGEGVPRPKRGAPSFRRGGFLRLGSGVVRLDVACGTNIRSQKAHHLRRVQCMCVCVCLCALHLVRLFGTCWGFNFRSDPEGNATVASSASGLLSNISAQSTLAVTSQLQRTADHCTKTKNTRKKRGKQHSKPHVQELQPIWFLC